jgi:hypothetical protein
LISQVATPQALGSHRIFCTRGAPQILDIFIAEQFSSLEQDNAIPVCATNPSGSAITRTTRSLRANKRMLIATSLGLSEHLSEKTGNPFDHVKLHTLK